VVLPYKKLNNPDDLPETYSIPFRAEKGWFSFFDGFLSFND